MDSFARFTRVAVACFLIHAASPHSFAETFTLISVPGGFFTTARGINARGDIVGYFAITPLGQRGFLLKDGVYTTIDSGPNRTLAHGINSSGDIVGYSWNFVYFTTASSWILENGVLTRPLRCPFLPGCGPLQPVPTEAYGINDQGDIVGSYTGHGFLFSQGVFTSIDVPGALETKASGINARRNIVGSYKDAVFTSRGFLLRDGEFVTIEPPGSIHSAAEGINPNGQIVGWYQDAGFGLHGFLWQNGEFTTIDAPGATSTALYGINARGDVVGNCSLGGFVLKK